MSALYALRMNMKLAASACAVLAAIGGFAAAYSDYLPATRGYAKFEAKYQTDSALSVTTARIGNLQRESAETRLQINQVRRETLRADKFNRETQLKAASDNATRQLIQQRLDEIDDAIRDVNAERDRLRTVSMP